MGNKLRLWWETLVIWSFWSTASKLKWRSNVGLLSADPKDQDEFGMATNIGTWLIAMGGCIAFLGLCALPAAFGENPDKTLVSVGMTILSTGMMLIAGGFYLKSRNFGYWASGRTDSSNKRVRKATCDACGKNEPVIQCRVHQVHLCGDCVGKHYDFRSCAYVPSTRRSTTKGSAYSQASGA
jgi:hypothetical protein